MATVPATTVTKTNGYPTTDGKPMAETDAHRDNMVNAIDVLRRRYDDDPQVYVSGNMLMFYVRGNKRKHLAPDVFVVFGVPKHMRDNYLIWEEGKAPDGRGRMHIAYTATGTIDRRDWGLNWGHTTPGGSLIAANDVTLSLSIEAIAK